MKRLFQILIFIVCGLASGCIREQPQVIVITATFLPATTGTELITPNLGQGSLESTPVILSNPTPNPTIDPTTNLSSATSHTVQPGDTLFGIAQQYNVTIESLIASNAIPNPDLLEVGQILQLPSLPNVETPVFKILPDSRLVRSPEISTFDVGTFISQQRGYIRNATDVVQTTISNGALFEDVLNATEIVQRVSLEYSIDPRILLAILEYKAGWLSNPAPSEEQKLYPILSLLNSVGFDRSGLYKQLAYTANELNRGYYGWKTRGLRNIQTVDGVRLTLSGQNNAGTLALQYFFSLTSNYSDWSQQIGQNGLYQTYVAYFGDPFVSAIDPLIPSTLEQPSLTLPFASGEIWYFTGGAHGGWGAGSAWSSLDFAPPDAEQIDNILCYTSAYYTRAVASGIIARSEDGAVVLDLDGDGNEATGWTILYLHQTQTVAVGTIVNQGDPIGVSSCAGGFSTATHLHIARRYNGEWMPTDCTNCLSTTPAFVMSGWVSSSIQGQEYQGFLIKDGVTLQAEQGRNTTINLISW